MKEHHFVFVYGTLKRKGGLHHVLSTSEFVREARLRGAWRLVDLGAFPGLVEIPRENNEIHGEVYKISPEILARLDGIEGHPRFYERKIVTTEDDEEVWAYTLPTEEYMHYPKVAGGNW